MIRSALKRPEAVPAVLTLVAIIVGAIASPYFLDFRYLLDASSLYVETGLLALGMTLVIVCGHIDLSVSSTLALVACIVAKLLAAGHPALWVLPLGLCLGSALGLLNGFLVAKLKLPSFVVTLGTMAAYRGAAQAMMGAQSVKVPQNLSGIDFAKVAGTPIPLPLGILMLAAIAIALLLHRTVFGRWLYSVGINERASLFSGVPTTRVIGTVFTLSGLLAGFAGMVMASRLGVSRWDHARGMEVDAITAVVLGGASIYGGRGTVLGTMTALLLVALVHIGMGLSNITAEFQLTAVGTLLIISVIVTNVIGRGATRDS